MTAFDVIDVFKVILMGFVDAMVQASASLKARVLAPILANIGDIPVPLLAPGALLLLSLVFALIRAAAQTIHANGQEEDRQRRGIIRLYLQPSITGAEVFTPRALPAGDRYRIIITGTYSYRSWLLWSDADACYSEGVPHHGVYIDAQPAQPSEIDRASHAYSFSYTATGRRLSIFLVPRRGGAYDHRQLRVDVIPERAAESLAQTSVSLTQQRQIEAQEKAERKRRALEEERERAEREQQRQEAKQCQEARERERQLEEQQRREDETRKRQEEDAHGAELQDIATGLRIRAELEQNWRNSTYRRNLAQHHTDEVLKRKHEFGEIYYQIRSSPELLAIITVDAPLVFDWIKGWHDTILRAERVKALLPARRTEPAPAPALPPRPERRRLTEAEVRARIEYRIKREGRDKIATRIAKDDLLREYAEKLAEAHPEMDEDERQQRINEFAEQLIEDDNNDGTKIQ